MAFLHSVIIHESTIRLKVAIFLILKNRYDTEKLIAKTYKYRSFKKKKWNAYERHILYL